MIGMRVRDEDGIELADRGPVGRRPVAAQRPEPVTQDGIGQQTDAVELDEERRVAEIRDPDAAVARPARQLSRPGSPGGPAAAASRLASGPLLSAVSGSA